MMKATFPARTRNKGPSRRLSQGKMFRTNRSNKAPPTANGIDNDADESSNPPFSLLADANSGRTCSLRHHAALCCINGPIESKAMHLFSLASAYTCLLRHHAIEAHLIMDNVRQSNSDVAGKA